jgi:hypothetical protein
MQELQKFTMINSQAI